MPDLFGREREIGILDGLLEGVRDQGTALVIRGEAGVGKSALLSEAARRAVRRGMRVLTAEGVQAETHLDFAGLHQLLRPILPGLDDLPLPRREALRAAFVMGTDAAPGRFPVALAVLGLLADSAARDPLLLLLDDAHLLDHSSADVLAFVARRLGADPIVLLAAVNSGLPSAFDQVGLAELRLAALDPEAADALLVDRSPDLAPALRARVLDEAAGNPLALTELPIALRSESLPEGASLPDPLPLTERLEASFGTQLSELPGPSRTLLLATALDPGGSLAEVLAVAAHVVGADATDALESAVGARVAEVRDHQLRFRHPLMRSAIHQAASIAERRLVHAAWATLLEGQPDRAIWHRAAATLLPDERVAADLDAAASRAAGRGSVAEAIAAEERAAELSEDQARRGGRLLRAAEMSLELGQTELGRRLVRAAEPLDLAGVERTHLDWLRALADGATWSGGKRLDSLVEIAERMALGGRPDLALRCLLTAAFRCWWRNPEQATRAAVVAAAERLAPAPDDPTLLAILAHSDPVRHGALVIERIRHLTPDAGDPVASGLLGTAASAVWAFDLARGFLETAVEGLRAQGRLGLLVQALVSLAWAAVHLARAPLAESAAQEAIRLAREMGQLRWVAAAQLAEATIAAERGDLEGAETLTGEAEALLLRLGATSMLALGQFARGRGAVAHQHYAEGLEHHRRTLDPTDPAYHPFVGAWGLSDLVEAAAHTGRRDAAKLYLGQLKALAAATSGSLLQAEVGYARPMVAEDDQAEVLYRSALEHDLAAWPYYRGRMLLWYGRWLRRQRRVAESRAPLRAAREEFDALAFPALAGIARQELRASGETSRRHVPADWDRLTPQELQVAQLAAAGLSNREIGERLFLSPRTVGSHLYRVFPKLGIATRAELRDALEGKVAEAA